MSAVARGGPLMCPRGTGGPTPSPSKASTRERVGATRVFQPCPLPPMPFLASLVPWGRDGAWPASLYWHCPGCYQWSPITRRGVWWLSRGGCVPGGFMGRDVQGGRDRLRVQLLLGMKGHLQGLLTRVGSPGCTLGWDALHFPGPSLGRSGPAVALPLFPWAAGRWLCCLGCTAAACSLPTAPLAPALALWLKPPSPAQCSAGRRADGRAEGCPAKCPACPACTPGRAGQGTLGPVLMLQVPDPQLGRAV